MSRDHRDVTTLVWEQELVAGMRRDDRNAYMDFFRCYRPLLRIDPNSVPAIRLVERNGALYTLDNRRLAAFQQAGVNVPYRMATPQEIAAESWKFTTKNQGTSIRIRGQP